MPSTSRVVQAAPGPTPTKTAAAPCSISAKAASAWVVLPTATGIGMKRVNSARLSGSYSDARWRALLTWLWTRNRSAPCSAQKAPKRRAAPGRGGDGGLRAGGVDLLDPAGDQLLADRRGVGLGEDRLDLGVGGGGDPLEDRGRVVVAGLDALEVEDGEAAEAGEHAGAPGVDDGVHGGGEDRDAERDAGEVLLQRDVVRLDGLRAGRERDVLEAVGRADRVDLRAEVAPRGRLDASGDRGCRRSIDHVALLCRRLTDGLPPCAV